MLCINLGDSAISMFRKFETNLIIFTSSFNGFTFFYSIKSMHDVTFILLSESFFFLLLKSELFGIFLFLLLELFGLFLFLLLKMHFLLISMSFPHNLSQTLFLLWFSLFLCRFSIHFHSLYLSLYPH